MTHEVGVNRRCADSGCSHASVVTRFEEDKLSQFFIQNGQKIEIPAPTWEGLPDSSNITPELCSAQFQVFGDRDRFAEVGGFPQLNAALRIPMVLVMSIWDDVRRRLRGLPLAFCIVPLFTNGDAPSQHYANMLWLDSIYPPEKEGQPGGARGSCPQDSGVPAEVEAEYPNA